MEGLLSTRPTPSSFYRYPYIAEFRDNSGSLNRSDSNARSDNTERSYKSDISDRGCPYITLLAKGGGGPFVKIWQLMTFI